MKYLCIFFSFLIWPLAVSAQDIVIHEWGTATNVQLSDGSEMGGLNLIVSPEHELPDFVYSLGTDLATKRIQVLTKTSVGVGHKDVTMRLETPVIYFYLKKRFELGTKIDLKVDFHGGLLNEFYPFAEAHYEDIPDVDTPNQVRLSATSKSSLSWKGLQLGGNWKIPETDNPIWLAPRVKDAVKVRTADGEAEHYLFYRGVAHLPALYESRYEEKDNNLRLTLRSPSLAPTHAWFLHVKQNGSIAFRSLANVGELDNSIALSFAAAEYSSGHSRLRIEIKKALVKEGLFPNEADAMLNTWEASYFAQPGVRVLYTIPRRWIDEHLPLQISVPAEIERVFIGRIDLPQLSGLPTLSPL